MNPPRISIVIPVFNRPDMIAQCLESVIAQSFPDWEALVVDDGSTDQTCDVVRSFARRDPRIRILQRDREPKSACTCRNIGLDAARGEFVVFHDSDDLLHPRCFSQRVEAMDHHPEVDFVVSPAVMFERNIEEISGFLGFPFKKKVNDITRFLTSEYPWLASGPTWRKSFLSHHQYRWPENYPRWQDGIFHYRILLDEPNYLRLELFDSYYRNGHSDKVSASTWNRKWLDLIFEDYPNMLAHCFQQRKIDATGVKHAVHGVVYRLHEQGFNRECFALLKRIRQKNLSHGKIIYIYCIAKRALNILFLGTKNHQQISILKRISCLLRPMDS